MEIARNRIKISVNPSRPVENRQLSTGSNKPDPHHPVSADVANKTLFEICSSAYYRRVSNKIPSNKGMKRLAKNETNDQISAAIIQRTNSVNKRIQDDMEINTPKSFGPRVEFVNGKIVIKEQNSDQNNENDLDVDAENNDVDVEESNDICTTTYSSFSKRRRTAAWGIQETSNFYNALRQCGTDFSLMQAFFPGRTRAELKKKFQKEDRTHPELVKKSLENTIPLDLNVFRVPYEDLNALEDIKMESTHSEEKEKDSIEHLSSSRNHQPQPQTKHHHHHHHHQQQKQQLHDEHHRLHATKKGGRKLGGITRDEDLHILDIHTKREGDVIV